MLLTGVGGKERNSRYPATSYSSKYHEYEHYVWVVEQPLHTI